MRAPHGTKSTSTVSWVVSAWAVLVFFTLLRLLPIILLLVLEAEGTLTFEASTQSHMWRLMSLRSRTTASMAVPCPAISLHEAKRERVRLSAQMVTIIRRI